MTGCFLVISEAVVSVCLKNNIYRKFLCKTLLLSVKLYISMTDTCHNNKSHAYSKSQKSACMLTFLLSLSKVANSAKEITILLISHQLKLLIHFPNLTIFSSPLLTANFMKPFLLDRNDWFGHQKGNIEKWWKTTFSVGSEAKIL